MSLTITEAMEKDVTSLYELTVALAEYERRTPDQIFVTEDKLRKWAFGPTESFRQSSPGGTTSLSGWLSITSGTPGTIEDSGSVV